MSFDGGSYVEDIPERLTAFKENNFCNVICLHKGTNFFAKGFYLFP